MALTDPRVPPSHRLESLRGDRKGQSSIRINDQWRLCFRWTDHGAQRDRTTGGVVRVIAYGVPVLGSRYGFLLPDQRRLKTRLLFPVDAGLL